MTMSVEHCTSSWDALSAGIANRALESTSAVYNCLPGTCFITSLYLAIDRVETSRFGMEGGLGVWIPEVRPEACDLSQVYFLFPKYSLRIVTFPCHCQCLCLDLAILTKSL